jgi:hypothetical protein
MTLAVHDVGAVAGPEPPARRSRGEAAALVTWCVVVAAALVWGTATVRTEDVGLHAAPFKGHWAWHGGWRLLPAAGLGLAVAAWGPAVAARLAWRRVPWATGVAAAAWTAALAAGDGLDRITHPLTTRFEYEPFAAGIGRGEMGPFLSTYVDRLGTYPIHVQGHPPGPVVLAWLLDRAGLGGAGWLAAVAIGAWGVAVGAVLVTARAVAGERAARRAAPALAVLPAAIWAGTSVDPVFVALAAVAIALATTAVTSGADPKAGDRRRRPALLAAGAGVVFGLGLLCSYGTVPMGLVLVAATVAAGLAPGRRLPIAPLVLVALGTVATVALAAGAGFWWPAGLEATRTAYWEGIGSRRPALFMTLVGNPAVVAMATGPLVALGLAHLVPDARRALSPLFTRAPSGAWRRGRRPGPGRDGPGRTRPAPDPGGTTGLGPPAPDPAGPARGSAGESVGAWPRESWPGRLRAGRPDRTRPAPDAGETTGGRAAAPGAGGSAGAWGRTGGRVWPLTGAALVAVTVADLSQLARGEVERIWLPFVPWLALAAPGDRRGWLVVQVGVALALQSLLVSPW